MQMRDWNFRQKQSERIAFCCLVGFVALVPIAGCAISTAKATRTVTAELETSPLTSIKLSTFNGSVSVVPHDKPYVSMEVSYSARGQTQEQAEANCSQLDYAVEAEDGCLVIRAIKPSGIWNASAAFELAIPEYCAIEINTSNGRVSAEDLSGKVAVDTSNGAVKLKRINNEISVRTSNGSVEIEDSIGSVDLKTSNGRVSLSGMLVGTENRIRTSNGTVTLSLPKDTATEIEASTSNGRIACTLPQLQTINQKKRSLHAVVGTEGEADATRVSISTSNGKININEWSADAPADPIPPEPPRPPTPVPAGAEGVGSAEIDLNSSSDGLTL